MVAFQIFEQSLIHSCNETGIDECCIHSGFFFQLSNHFFAQSKERAKPKNGNLPATVRHFITVQQLAVILLRFDAARKDSVGRNTNGYGMLRLMDPPLQHGKILLTASRSQINHVRNVADDRNIEQAKVSDIVHCRSAAPKDENQCGIVVDTEVLRQLVVGALDESAVHPEYRFPATGGNGRRHGNGVLLGNAHIDKLTPRLFATLCRKAEYGGCARCDADNGTVFLHLLQQIPCRKVAVIFLIAGVNRRATRLQAERSTVMETFLLLLGKAVAFTFEGIDVYRNRVVDVFHLSEGVYQCLHVIAVFHVQIIQSHGGKEVARRLTVGFAQQLQVAIQAAVIFGNGHLVVVHNHDEVRSQFGCIVQPFKSLAAA